MICEQDIIHALNWAATGLRRGRPFIILPSQVACMRDQRKELTARVQERISLGLQGDYEPDHLRFFEIPKKGKGTRQAPVFSLADEGVMLATLTSHYQLLLNDLEQPVPPIDYARALPSSAADDGWIENFIEPYRAFRARARHFQEQGQHVLCLDICNFAPSARPDILIDRLHDAGMDPAIANLLLQAMNVWHTRDGMSGIPLGSLSCDIFIKVLLHPVDLAMRETYGDAYFRYMDDFRIAMNDEQQASHVIARLESLLAPLGLSLNHSKTKILEQPDQNSNLISALTDAGFTIGADTDEEHAVELLSDSDLRALYSNVIRPRLYNKTSASFALTRETLKAMGTRHMRDPVEDFDVLLSSRDRRIRYAAYYIERSACFDEAAPKIVAALEKPDLGGFEHYALFRTLNRHYAQNPEAIQGAVAHWVSNPALPAYMRGFSEDVRHTCAMPLADRHPAPHLKLS